MTMKSKMRKKLIAFMLCMVLVICNSVSILADAPAAATTTTEKQVKETGTAKSEGASEEEQSADDEKDTSEQSDEESAPETETTEKKEETTEATTEDKEDATTATTTKAKEETTEATETGDKDQTTGAEDDSDKKDKTSETSEEETTETTEKTTETTEEASTEKAEETTQSPAYDGKYEDSTVTISVSAEAGIVPEGAELSVTPIVKTDITDDMSDEDKVKAEEVNAQYDLTEKKLTEDSEANEETMEGFLAYDISFIVDGEEVEPNGDVKVVMDFKEAAVPEDVSENATVAVKHLKEVESAADGVVVEDMSEKATVESTDKAEVQKVEMTSDSFSTFTITWTTSGYTITVHYVNEKYQEITSGNVQKDDILINDESKEIVLSEYVSGKTIDGYKYSGMASLGKPDLDEDGNVIGTVSNIAIIRCNNNSLQYKRNNDSQIWRSWDSDLGYHVYLVYNTQSNSTSAVIETINNNAENITINLFDYTTGNTETSKYEGGKYTNQQGINSGHTLKFMSNTTNLATTHINGWTGGSRINSGIVKNTLENGYPSLISNNERLAYLFNPDSSVDGKTVYGNTNYLLTKDSDGYFSFDSDKNYAEFDTESREFTVYSRGLKVFYPFDAFSEVAGKTLESFHGGSVGLGAGSANHYFGMTMSATFFQPKGGKVNGNDMVFEFSGDDDVWVFIDDKLVLDLGGIHDEASGSINFATGEVRVNGDIQHGKGLFDILEEDTFEDYSQHTIKFFYLERGNNASNCKLKFNLPTIPENSIFVAKEVVDEENKAVDYAGDIDFQFNIKKEIEGELQNYALEPYEIYEESIKVDDGTTDENGNFTLKHGQMAVFAGFSAIDEYQITETGAFLNGYAVSYNGKNITIGNTTDEEGYTIYSASTDRLVAGADNSVVFRNAVTDTTSLKIRKEFKQSTNTDDKNFQIKIAFEGKAYTGSYRIDGKSNSETAVNGIISLKANETAIISGLPYGTSFEIYEIQDGSYLPTYVISDTGIYDASIPVEDDNAVYTVSGKVMGKDQAQVTIINDKVSIASGTTSVTINKSWYEEEKYSALIPDSITVTLYQDVNHNGEYDTNDTIVTEDANGSPISAEVTITKINNWQYVWNNLPADTDYVVKETYPNGFEWKTTKYSNELSNFQELGRVTSCKNTRFNLGKNNMLLIKKTDGNYYLWTVYDLKLTDDQIKEIAAKLKEFKLNGSGNLNLDNLQYDWGISSEDAGITLSKTEAGWQLAFAGTSVWSMFWNFKYDRTEHISLINQIDDDLKTEVNVNKEWRGGNDSRQNVTVELIPTVDNQKLTAEQINWSGEVSIKLDQASEWKHTYENLPYYYYDTVTKTYKKIIYTVTETGMNNDFFEMKPGEVVGNYFFEVQTNGENDFTIINTKVEQWAICKVSSSDNNLTLGGAKFTLTKEGEETPSYYGFSNSDGYVGWFEKENPTEDDGPIMFLPDGTYVMEEIEAPSGYQKTDEKWTIVIENYALKEIRDGDGNIVPEMKSVTREATTIKRYLFENDIVYDLPSAGGPGVYWYTLSGTLLMIGAALIVYRQKRKREVLLRK